jgi:hypothetical protein
MSTAKCVASRGVTGPAVTQKAFCVTVFQGLARTTLGIVAEADADAEGAADGEAEADGWGAADADAEGDAEAVPAVNVADPTGDAVCAHARRHAENPAVTMLFMIPSEAKSSS